MIRSDIDSGQGFDFGRTSARYARSRDIYPESLYQKLTAMGIGKPGQQILDLGSGTGVLPLRLYPTGACFTVTDIAENQIVYARQLAAERHCERMSFRVCGAEDTGFADNTFDAVTAVQCFHYFDADRAAQEIHRVLKPGGLFAKVFMDWLPFEDEKIAEMECLVLRYNPKWSGGGFREYTYVFPEWAENRFKAEAVVSYDETLVFQKEQWLERVLTCRGVGAALPEECWRHMTRCCTSNTKSISNYIERFRKTPFVRGLFSDHALFQIVCHGFVMVGMLYWCQHQTEQGGQYHEKKTDRSTSRTACRHCPL